MGSTLQSGHARLAVGAVVGAIACTLFAVGALDGPDRPEQDPSELGAVEPIPPASQSAGPTATTTTGASSPSSEEESSAESTTTTTTTATTTTTTDAEQPDEPTTT